MTIATPIADSFSDYVAPAEIRQGIYTDSSVFRAELERIFYRTWIYLGHECQLDAPGSFFLGHIGLTSVVVVRDRDNAIHVLENRCSHRGPPVCRELHGRANVLTCPYHGWSFKLNGDLLRVPFDSDYTERFCRERRGLKRVPRVDSYRGFIFASMAEGGPNLETFLGTARSALDDFMDRAPEGVVDLVDHTPLRHRYRGNWKIQFENLGDFIHPLFAHGSAMNASLNVQNAGNDSQDGIVDLIAGFNTFVGKISDLNYQITKYGHSFAPGVAKLSGVLQESDRRLAEVLARTRGEEEGRRIFEKAGAHDIWSAGPDFSHLSGGTIMGKDPATSVTNAFGQTHDVPNLYVAGASVFPTGGAFNPTFTVYALARRTARHILSS